MQIRTHALFAAALLASVLAAPAQPLFSFETGLDGWVISGFNAQGVSLGNSTTGATHGAQSLAITQTNGGFSWNAKRDNAGQDDFYNAMNTAATNPSNWRLEMDVTYRDASIPDDPGLTFLNISIFINSQLGFKNVHSQALTTGHEDKTEHLVIPLTNFAAEPLATNSTYYQLGIGMNGNWGAGTATVYFDNISLTEVPPPPEKLVINRFDTQDESDVDWRYDFGLVAYLEEWDPTMDADTNAASGSLKFTFTFDAMLGGDNQIGYTRDIFPALDGATLDSLRMDVFVASTSAMDAFGNFGFFELVTRNTSMYSYNPQDGRNLTVTDQWIHIDTGPLVDPVNEIRGITLKLYGGPQQNITGGYTMWIDNVCFTLPPSNPPSPTLTLKPVTPGLEIAASIFGDNERYQRQAIRTASTDFSWLAVAGPVTYSCTIASFPAPTFNGFEAQMLLVGNNPAPGGAADYNEANVVYLRILENPGGAGYVGELRYKVGAAFMSIFNGPFVTNISTATILGTWGMTLNGTNATIFAPDGTMASGSFGQDVLTAFDQSCAVYIGLIPNELANIGQSVVFSGVTVTGANTPLMENFANLDNWVTTVAQGPSGVFLVPAGAIRKVCWPAAAAGFTLRERDMLTSVPEVTWPLSTLPVRTIGTNKVVVLGPDAGNRFFRLEK